MAPIKAQAVREGQEILLRLNNHLRTSPWRSLPELTQANGEVSFSFQLVWIWVKHSRLEVITKFWCKILLPCEYITFVVVLKSHCALINLSEIT